jgi:hypothetical protein
MDDKYSHFGDGKDILDGASSERDRIATMEAALRAVIRVAEAAKEPCEMDPESPAAIRNGRFASIAQVAAQGLGWCGGPALGAHGVAESEAPSTMPKCKSPRSAYVQGHKDARHAAAELVATASSGRSELLEALKEMVDAHAIPSSGCKERPAYERARALIQKHTKEPGETGMDERKTDGVTPVHPDEISEPEWRAICADAGVRARAFAGIYVECCQCDNCQHIGINDAPGEKAACNSCDWTGAAPQEDRCPGCGETGAMTRACPKCGGQYRCVAEGNIDAQGEPVPAGVRAVDPVQELRSALAEVATIAEHFIKFHGEDQAGQQASVDHAFALLTRGVKGDQRTTVESLFPSSTELWDVMHYHGLSLRYPLEKQQPQLRAVVEHFMRKAALGVKVTQGPSTADAILRELVESNKAVAAYRSADGLKEYRRLRDRHHAALQRAHDYAAGVPGTFNGQEKSNG